MRPLDIVAATFLYRTKDGRVVFRPRGKNGSCYLVTETQRRLFAKFQMAYYALMLVAIVGGQLLFGTLIMAVAILPVFVLGNHVLFWFFTRGLPTTDPPPLPTPEERRESIREINRKFGRPFLWTLLLVSSTMAGLALYAGIATGNWLLALLPGGFFGICAVVFHWQLRNQ